MVAYGDNRVFDSDSIFKFAWWLITTLDGIFSVNELSRACNVHRSTLYRIFMTKIGVTPGKFIKKYKFDVIKSYLAHHDEAVPKAIPEQFGFADYPSLCKAFKKATGLTMGQYRKYFLYSESKIPSNLLRKLWKFTYRDYLLWIILRVFLSFLNYGEIL